MPVGQAQGAAPASGRQDDDCHTRKNAVPGGHRRLGAVAELPVSCIPYVLAAQSQPTLALMKDGTILDFLNPFKTAAG